MKNESIRWQTLPRDALPDAIFASRSLGSLGEYTLNADALNKNYVALGFSDSRRGFSYNPPCVFVIPDKMAQETFSWLRVYAPETSPLSQFGRVVSGSDWKRFNLDGNSQVAFAPREDRWASIIVGEAIAQGDSDIDLINLPLSRASGCFSTAIGRATCVYSSNEAIHTCVERLGILEANRHFVRRLVSVRDLLPVWSVADSLIVEPLSSEEAVAHVLDAASSYLSNSMAKNAKISITLFRDFPGLKSDSIEERVLAFQKLANELTHTAAKAPQNQFSAVLLAAAAFLVGRSTTHEFLLRRVRRAFPVAPVWFGLIAALSGPRSWDPSWARAAKGVERQIRSKFDWSESLGFDLCWAEFTWFAGTYETGDVFSTLPKLMPKVLSIEVVPGAICQFRLAAGSSAEAEPQIKHEETFREKELQSALVQFIGLAAITKQLLEGKPSSISLTSPTSPQQSLHFGGGINPRPSRLKKPKNLGGDN